MRVRRERAFGESIAVILFANFFFFSPYSARIFSNLSFDDVNNHLPRKRVELHTQTRLIIGNYSPDANTLNDPQTCFFHKQKVPGSWI